MPEDYRAGMLVETPLNARIGIRVLLIAAACFAGTPAAAEPAVQLTSIIPLDSPSGSTFGSAVDHEGTLALVGAFGSDDFGDNTGAAFLYDLVTGERISTILPPEPSDFARFGNAVALTGNLAIIGAPFAPSVDEISGKVYVIDLATGETVHTLSPPEPTPEFPIGVAFGAALATNGRHIIVGAPDAVDTAIQSSVQKNVAATAGAQEEFILGNAFVFELESGDLLYKYESLDVMDDFFGRSVAISDTHAVIGATTPSNFGDPIGYAIVIDLSTGAIVHRFESDHKRFGESVAIDATSVFVAQHPPNGLEFGAVFEYDIMTGELVKTYDAPSFMRGSGFGSSIAIASTYLLVGADADDESGNFSGSVPVFSRSSGGFLHTLRPAESRDGEQLGYAVSASDEIAVATAPSRITALKDPPGPVGPELAQGAVFAFEPTCPGDCDRDRQIGFNDLMTMLLHFDGPASRGCDTDGDGAIDFDDLVAALFRLGGCER